MKVRKILGARLLVDPIITTLSLEQRAANAGLEIVVENENRPRPTMGRVVAVGTDPLLREEIKVGDIVSFMSYAGHDTTLEGHVFRTLEFQDITMVESDVPTPIPSY